MKNILVATICFAFAISFLSGCTHDFTNINTDPNGTANAHPEQLLAPALVNALSVNMSRNRSFNNELMQVTVSQSEDETAVFRYNFPVSWSDYMYNNLYSQLTNFRDIYLMASDSTKDYNTSYMGISLICQSWLFSILTDTYGDIPYSQALLGRDSLNFTPKFDKQKDIYFGLFKNLESANTLLKKGTAISGGNDPVFGGDVTKWRRFGNSLYLRLLLRLSGKAEVRDTCIGKIQKIVGDTISNPIMASNTDGAILRWTGVGAYVSPWYSVRAQTFRSIALCSFFLNNLVNWQDPRINIPTYGTNGVNRWGIAPDSTGQIRGVASGYSPSQGEPMNSYFYATDQTVNKMSPPANCLQLEPLTGMIMNYAELQFILAECAAKGWINGSAASYYNAGVQNSITLWLPNWQTPVLDYLNAADIAWDDSESLNIKMEKIHLQKYYTLFCADYQQWFEYRRTGHPILPKGPGLKNGGVMPARMPYPAYLLGSNPTNYATAIADQGPDVMSTQVWWQKP